MKTPYQKHRKDEEAKKKRDEEETARLLEQFKESFEGDDPSGPRAFVRGGTIDPNLKPRNDPEGGNSKDGVSVPKKGSRYVPTFLPPISKGREPEKKEDEKQKEKEKGKVRVIDKYVEELKLAQELRDKRNQDRELRREGRHDGISATLSHFDEPPDGFDLSGKVPGSFDDGDPQTTNLYVGNLSPQVDENFLLRTFGRFGPIASVKIMWPRTEEERRKQRNCGFVAFMNRVDAQAAKDEMQGVVIFEYELKLGWGKSVPLPSQALPAPPPGQMAIRNKEGGAVILSGTHSQPASSITSKVSDLVLTPNVPDIVIVPPKDNHLRHVIDTMALYILDGGCSFEQAIMQRCRGNPLFGFLFDLGSKEHAYYVWRLYSFAQGDTLQRWRTEPFIMITGSGRWIPPSLPTVQSPEREKEAGTTFAAGRNRRVELERSLTDAQRDEFEDMLRSLTLERSLIKDAMGFALDNADAAGEIVEVLSESLTLKETPIPTKVARLMLVSDILHNSSAPVKNSSAYRTKFEATLPDIMESFNDLYCSITGRITAEALKERVLKVFQVWSDWFLFSDAYVNGLRTTFLRSGNSGVVPFHSLCGDAPEIEKRISSENPSDVVKINQDGALAIGKGAAMKELLGLPLVELEKRCRHNGLSLCGGREMMVARLLYLEDAEKQRGYDDVRSGHSSVSAKYTDDESQTGHSSRHGVTDLRTKPITQKSSQHRVGGDVAGDAMFEPSVDPVSPDSEAGATTNKKGRSTQFLPASKWNREDDGSNDDGDDKNAQVLGLSYSSPGSRNAVGEPEKGDEIETETVSFSGSRTHNDNSMSEEHRQKLRRLEVAVLEYQESLEEQGMHNKQEIDKKVENHRRRLQSEFGLLDSSDDQSSNKHPTQRTRTGTDQDNSTYESLKKRRRSHSRSRSPPSKSSSRDKGRRSNSRDRHRSKDQSYERDKDRRK
ncbi:ENTH/VHS domain-containing protein [Dioscorea alata]|uniref:ENTH/VHS domain-containing protein n=1 Tax=Dioscorea alata TaxID=55571 RepID=A0ACB7VDH9_DIOAL|nr:ENTH/VHS domain-containing protein [Dioscorea alata]